MLLIDNNNDCPSLPTAQEITSSIKAGFGLDIQEIAGLLGIDLGTFLDMINDYEDPSECREEISEEEVAMLRFRPAAMS